MTNPKNVIKDTLEAHCLASWGDEDAAEKALHDLYNCWHAKPSDWNDNQAILVTFKAFEELKSTTEDLPTLLNSIIEEWRQEFQTSDERFPW